MSGIDSSPGDLRFGVFEVDVQARELRKKGAKVKLQQQPFELLLILLGRPGEVVTREELRQKLWPADVYVDFDRGLNKAMVKLRDALGDSSDSPIYIETLPRMGYRFIGPVNGNSNQAYQPAIPAGHAELAKSGVSDAVGVAQAPTEVKTSHWYGRARVLQSVLALLVIAAISTSWVVWRQSRSFEAIHSLAVLPLQNLSGSADQEYLSDGATDEIITQLARIPALRVVSRTSIMQYKGTRKPLPQIADELHVDAIVEGSVARAGDQVRITAQLIDARTDRHLWAQSFAGQMNNLLAVQSDVALQIASQTQVALTPVLRESLKETRTFKPEAVDAYFWGRYFYDKRTADAAQKSVANFQRAVSIDPEYPAAWAGLSEALASESHLSVKPASEVMPTALDAARRALKLDPNQGEAHTALGSILNTYVHDWGEAETELLRGISLSPSFSLGEMEYAVYLDAAGRPQEAITHMRRALELDPQSFLMNRHLGSALYFDRQYDEALKQLHRAEDMQPSSSGVVQNWIAWIYEKKGLRDDAVRTDLLLLAHWGESAANLDFYRSNYRQGGWTAYWQARIARTVVHPSDACSAYELGLDYIKVENHDRAFSLLKQAAEHGCAFSIWTRVDPLLDDLRSDPRYEELLQVLNEAPVGGQTETH